MPSSLEVDDLTERVLKLVCLASWCITLHLITPALNLS